MILCCERINNLKIKNKAMVLVDCTEYLHYSSVPDDCTIISCGAGEKNTVSLSSISDNAIVLNIAREIKRLEIQECVINTEKPIKNIYTALFAYTVLILTNKEEPPCLQDTKAI